MILLISYTHFISIKIIISHFTLRSSKEATPVWELLIFGEKKLMNKQNKMKNKPIMNRI